MKRSKELHDFDQSVAEAIEEANAGIGHISSELSPEKRMRAQRGQNRHIQRAPRLDELDGRGRDDE